MGICSDTACFPSIDHFAKNGSPYRSAINPKPGLMLVKPKVPGTMSMMSILGGRRLGALHVHGPVSGCTTSRLNPSSDSDVESGVHCPSEASRVSRYTSSSGSTSSAGGMSGCQRLCPFSRLLPTPLRIIEFYALHFPLSIPKLYYLPFQDPFSLSFRGPALKVRCGGRNLGFPQPTSLPDHATPLLSLGSTIWSPSLPNNDPRRGNPMMCYPCPGLSVTYLPGLYRPVPSP